MAGFNAFLKSNNIVTGTQIPTEGNYKTGDIVVNIGPNSAAEPMWICNEGGNPGVWGPVGVGGGSGSIVSINSSVLVSEPVHEVSLESLGVAVTKRDKLLVHYNSTHLLEGVHFEIVEEGTKIAKLGDVGEWNTEGLDNCMFAFELFKGVQNIDGNEITVASKMACKTNHVIIENPCGEVEIGIEGFKSENDTLMVFKNGVIMVEGVDYTIEGDIITSTGEVWNENGIEDYGMTFVVFKEVIEYNGDASNIDLSGKQDKTDESLLTESKDVIGAINELFQNANNGKELIASAIGEPLNAEDTFSAMSDKINVMKSDLKQVLMDEGVSVTEEDTMASLISKVDSEFDRQVVPAGDVVEGYVVEGKTFMNSTGQVLTGTMTEHGIYTGYAGYFTTTDENMHLGIQPGAYLLPSGSGYPEIMVPKSIVNNLSPENIVSGKEILGVWGTATASSLGGMNFATGTSAPVGFNSGLYGVKITGLSFKPSLVLVVGETEYYYGYIVNINGFQKVGCASSNSYNNYQYKDNPSDSDGYMGCYDDGFKVGVLGGSVFSNFRWYAFG